MCLAVPGEVTSIVDDGDPLSRMAHVSFGGVVKQASLALVPGARVGDYVLVHAGVAIQTVSEAHAEDVFRYLETLEEP